MRFIDLFAGLGGFHLALSSLGAECVFAAEIDDTLRDLYATNFPAMRGKVVGDVRAYAKEIPPHDILCAGFPCQPFSKSGFQEGTGDRLRGTLHHEIVKIIGTHLPKVVILENVGNFERHDDGQTWRSLRQRLKMRGYSVFSTGHKLAGGPGLISPHHLGLPQRRERFYIVAVRGDTHPDITFPDLAIDTSGFAFREQSYLELTAMDRRETKLSQTQLDALSLWAAFQERVLDLGVPMPNFAIWTDCFGRRADASWPTWKSRIAERNDEWYKPLRRTLGKRWLRDLRDLPASYRKLEWNAGDHAPLMSHTLQFRPSGIRVSRSDTFPAIVAMTPSQAPVIGRRKRFITRVEALNLQGFPRTWKLPTSRSQAFRAIGNAVHPAVVRAVAESIICAK